MTQFGYIDSQILQANQAAILQNVRSCTSCPQMVIHENLTSNIILRGLVSRPCDSALYSVRFSGNIAVPTGGTAGEIQLAFYADGAVRPLTIGAATPAGVEEFWYVSGEDIITVPIGCCPIIYVGNATTNQAPVEVRNLQVFVDRVMLGG